MPRKRATVSALWNFFPVEESGVCVTVVSGFVPPFFANADFTARAIFWANPCISAVVLADGFWINPTAPESSADCFCSMEEETTITGR